MGIDKDKLIYVEYGSPIIDGEIDEIWGKTSFITPQLYQGNPKCKAQFKLLWDERALYILALIYDNFLDDSNSVPYEQDSIEIFLDERNDKAKSYKDDDVHFRVNFKNRRTCDYGEILRFYSKTKIINGGYLVEARIRFKDKPEKGKSMGFEFQINDAYLGRRIGTINTFDDTGKAWQNPSLFGNIVLIGEKNKDKNRLDYHDLLAYVEYINSIDTSIFINGDTLVNLLNNIQNKINSFSNQEEIDSTVEDIKSTLLRLKRSEKFEEPENLPIIEDIPNIFVFSNGEEVSSKEDWYRRRKEIEDLYQFYMYGYFPDKEKERVFYEIEENTLIIKVQKENKTVSFKATFNLPKNIKNSYPVIICIGFLGNFDFKNMKFIDYTNIVNERGYALISFNPIQVAEDNDSYKGAFYELYPYSTKIENDRGVLLAWAWGASKILDALYSGAIPTIDPKKCIITGFSRYGKAAILAGAFDERFLITNPHASGAGGTALFRLNFEGKKYPWGIAENTEPFFNLKGSSEGHWFNSVFKEFKDVRKLPFDQHFLISLCAPRAVIITGGYSDWWTNPEGTYKAFLEAKKVYEFLGFPEKIGFAMRDGGHSITYEDIENLLDFCDLQLGLATSYKDFHKSKFEE